MELDRPNPADHMLMFKKKLWVTEYSTRMQRMLRGEKLPPLRIDAEPHRRCNLKCVHCAREQADYNINEYSKRVEVPESRWYEIAHESGEMGVKAWNIAGIGEPMFKPDMMMRLMSIIKEHGMFGELTTNGWYWDDEHIRQTIEMGWDCISISIDGPDASSHEAIRRMPGSFERACATAKRFSELRRKRRTHLPNLTVNVVLSRFNYDKLPEMVNLAYKLGADVLFVEPMVVYNDYQREQVMVTPAQRNYLKAGLDKALALSRKRNIYAFFTCLDGDDETKEFNPDLAERGGNMRDVILKGTLEQAKRYRGDSGNAALAEDSLAPFHQIGEVPTEADEETLVRHIMNIPCYYPWLNLMITAEGNAVHCGECDVFDVNIKDKSLREIWYGDHLDRFRERHGRGQLSSFCERCRPNVIGDMKLLRKSLHEYARPEKLQDKLVKMMEHSLNLKRELYYQQHGGFLHPIKNRLFPSDPGTKEKIRIMSL